MGLGQRYDPGLELRSIGLEWRTLGWCVAAAGSGFGTHRPGVLDENLIFCVVTGEPWKTLEQGRDQKQTGHGKMA